MNVLLQIVRTLKHKHICVFLDCLRGKHERIVTVSEFYKSNLKDKELQEDDPETKGACLLKWAGQCLSALSHLHSKGFVHASLDTTNILFDHNDDVKLYNAGLGHMTNYGEYVDFPIFEPRYSAPEILAKEPPDFMTSVAPGQIGGDIDPADGINQIPEAPEPRYDARCDIWSLGMVLLTKFWDLNQPWPSMKLVPVIRKIISFSEDSESLLERLARDHDQDLHEMPQSLRELLEQCLRPQADDRPTAQELLSSQIFDEFKPNGFIDAQDSFPCLKLRCQDLTWPPEGVDFDRLPSPMDLLSLEETYYLWKLAGGDILGELRKHGIMVTMPPMLLLPKIVLGEGHLEGVRRERSTLYDPVVIPLSLSQLTKCLDDVPVEDCFPLVLNFGEREDLNGTMSEVIESNNDQNDTANLPLVIKEGDVRYQFKRIVLYRRLLNGYPFHRPQIWREARLDALPMYRAYIWASLLGIEHDTVARYQGIDKDSWTPTDRQIEVDIPRCHQYNTLLASPEGHRKFKRVLKAWVATNPQYVYWQGLDSLSAPFIYLNFNDEPLAFACLSAFIPKYLHGMFQRDNAAVIQEYLAKFSHVQAFHEPQLFCHLDGIGFIPDLYAIPWILTMFAHVFPLQNIFHLWDKLLLGDSSFPLCIGLAILMQLKERLLQSEFNECILLFSDLPAVDIERCVKDSIKCFCSTPKSLVYRKYGNPLKRHKQDKKEGSEDPKSVTSITLKQQKSEKLPRLSGHDLLELLALDARGEGQSKVLVIDTRPLEEYKKGTLPGALHLSYNGAFNPEGQLNDKNFIETLNKERKSRVLCVAGGSGPEAETETRGVAEGLLQLQYPRLCILHNGIEIFKSGSSNVLQVPNA